MNATAVGIAAGMATGLVAGSALGYKAGEATITSPGFINDTREGFDNSAMGGLVAATLISVVTAPLAIGTGVLKGSAAAIGRPRAAVGMFALPAYMAGLAAYSVTHLDQATSRGTGGARDERTGDPGGVRGSSDHRNRPAHAVSGHGRRRLTGAGSDVRPASIVTFTLMCQEVVPMLAPCRH